MSDVADRMRWPETPEDMHDLLAVEDNAKAAHGLTQRGLSGYLLLYYCFPKGGDNSGTIERGILRSDRDAA